MIIKVYIKLFFILSIIFIFVLNFVHTQEIDEDDKARGDQFYLILVKNKLKEEGKNSHEKRGEKDEFLLALITEINNLIIGNMNTYEDPSKLERLEQNSTLSPFSKRSEGLNHRFAYLISSLENESLIYSYLSKFLVPLVSNLPNVIIVIPDVKMEENAISNERLKILKNFSPWKNPCVKGSTYNYLSLISQNWYNSTAPYDENYYYPSSAGKGINIFILDKGFNFRHFEYSNKDDRTAQCLISISQEGIYGEFNDLCSYEYEDNHGNAVADIAGGLTNGVANKANIYGIVIYRDKVAYTSTFIKALEFINQFYLNVRNPKNVENFIYKTVINISSAIYMNDYEKRTYDRERRLLNYLYNLIEVMSNKGSVFVASAGNDSVLADNFSYPCTFDNVICVGAIDNIGINDGYYVMDRIIKNENNTLIYPNHDEWKMIKENALKRYNLIYENLIESKNMTAMNYRTAIYSNYGRMVDIYAPGFVKIYYQDTDGVNHPKYEAGTSFSAPIVAGVAATIMSENPNYYFNTKRMKEYLYEIGLKNVIYGIRAGHPNVFINNGKHLNYSPYGEYNTCGHSIDKQLCSNNSELECFYHGCCLKNNIS